MPSKRLCSIIKRFFGCDKLVFAGQKPAILRVFAEEKSRSSNIDVLSYHKRKLSADINAVQPGAREARSETPATCCKKGVLAGENFRCRCKENKDKEKTK